MGACEVTFPSTGPTDEPLTRKLYDPSMAIKATALYWKLEDVPVGDGEAPHPEDIGPAWIYRPDGSEEPVLEGEWITRADAQRIAAEAVAAE